MSAAEVLAQHRKLWTDTLARCSGCDWSQFGNIRRTDLAHGAHQLDALKAARYAVVELPPESVNPDAWANQSGGVTLRHHIDLVSNLTADYARTLAAALLAAADVTEGES